jgi:hypothetical protein
MLQGAKQEPLDLHEYGSKKIRNNTGSAAVCKDSGSVASPLKGKPYVFNDQYRASSLPGEPACNVQAPSIDEAGA